MVVAPKFNTEKVFIIVRNPLDSIYSQVNLSQTFGHSLQIANEVQDEFPEFWQNFVKTKVGIVKEFFEYVHTVMKAKVPVHFVRYEDLVNEPNKILGDLFAFLLDVDSIEGTVVEQRIAALAADGNEKNTIYQVKDNSQKFNKSAYRYDDEKMKLVKTELRDYLYYFGYADKPGCEDTFTTFVRYDEGDVAHDDELLESRFDGYKAHNQESMKAVLDSVENSAERPTFEMNGEGIEVKF